MEGFHFKEGAKPLPVEGPKSITRETIQRLRKETGFKGSDEEAEKEIKRRMKIGRKEAE